jgi:hypothetical protein
MPLPRSRAAQRHARAALRLLVALEDDLREHGVHLPPRYAPVDSRGRWARPRASLGRVALSTAGSVARGVGFVLRVVWRSVRVLLRLVYTLRAISR